MARAVRQGNAAGSDEPVLTHLYDTPGSTTLAANGEDEMVARDLILSGEMTGVILVADAKNLRRSLALALEVAEFELPMVMALNMLDEAEAMGIDVDDGALSQELGVPVGRTVAVENRGIRRLAELVPEAVVVPSRVRFPADIEMALDELVPMLMNGRHPPRALALMLLSGDPGAIAWVRAELGERVLRQALHRVEATRTGAATPLRDTIRSSYYAEAERIVDQVVETSAWSPGMLVRFGHLAERPFSGVLIGLGVLILAYYFIGAFGAGFVADSLSSHLFDGLLMPLAADLVAQIPSSFVRDAIMDPDFGLLPTGLFLALGIVLPVLFCFYLFQGVLEDSGYLPRLAVLLDRLFRWIGLNGQALIPLVLGFSCITMAIITTRILPSRRERIIMTLLLLLGIPCAPLLAVMMVILSDMPWTAGAAIFGTIGGQILLVGFIAGRVLPGSLPDLILEIPKMRIPRPYVVLRKTWRRTWDFMKEALPIFLAASFLVFLFDRLGGLTVFENLMRPFVQQVLGLPDEFVQIFIKTAIRRENGATELMHLRSRFDNLQVVVTMLVMTFLIPCINSAIVIFKERGPRTAFALLSGVILWALVMGVSFNFICRTLGVTFT